VNDACESRAYARCIPRPKLDFFALLVAVAALAAGCAHERKTPAATPAHPEPLYSVRHVRAAFAAEGLPLAPVGRDGQAVTLALHCFTVCEDPGDLTVYVWTTRSARAGYVYIIASPWDRTVQRRNVVVAYAPLSPRAAKVRAALARLE